ncbi:MAG: NAD(P)H dehydrogenase [Rhodobacteraceae bacterium]|nr:NAD(P)H dehydrogenase [Paracoccaceae bacterium]|tara:strand:+ start:234 stop:794 length:561 start_codon:yes stop_codon:yes gene_type:complete
MKILVVLCHPREESLTAQVANSFIKGAISNGNEVELVDLYKENFNPVLNIKDEPNDGNLLNYSQEVQFEFNRLNNNEAVVMIFPLWWWSMPAMLKGWVDRVWNYGLTYGEASHNIKKGLLISLAAHTQKELEKRDYYNAIDTSLNVGIFDYNKIDERELLILGGTDLGDDHCAKHIELAYKKGCSF